MSKRLEMVIIIIPTSTALWLGSTSGFGNNDLIDLQNSHGGVTGQLNGPLFALKVVEHIHFFAVDQLTVDDINSGVGPIDISAEERTGLLVLIESCVVLQSVGDHLERLSVFGITVLLKGGDFTGLSIKFI